MFSCNTLTFSLLFRSGMNGSIEDLHIYMVSCGWKMHLICTTSIGPMNPTFLIPSLSLMHTLLLGTLSPSNIEIWEYIDQHFGVHAFLQQMISSPITSSKPMRIFSTMCNATQIFIPLHSFNIKTLLHLAAMRSL